MLPKETAVAPVNPVPVNVTDVPPAAGPEVGEIDVITGIDPVTIEVPKVNDTVPSVTPAGVVTTIGAEPDPVRVVRVIVVSFTTVNGVTAPPTVTPVVPVKPDPVSVTKVPPIAGPEVGDTDVRTGATAT
jgi:hypothetical protein